MWSLVRGHPNLICPAVLDYILEDGHTPGTVIDYRNEMSEEVFQWHRLHSNFSYSELSTEHVRAAPLNRVEELWSKMYPFSSMAHTAARFGRLDVLQDIDIVLVGPCTGISSLMMHAISSGSLECVQWLVSKGHSITKPLQGHTAAQGQLDILKWIHEQGHEMDKRTFNAAVGGHHWDVIDWLESLDPSLNHEITSLAIEDGQWGRVFKYLEEGLPLYDGLLDAAMFQGNLTVFHDLVRRGCKVSSETFDSALLGGHVNAVELIRDWFHPPSSHVILRLVQEGKLDMLKWLHARGVQVHESLFMHSAYSHGRWDMANWLREIGCLEPDHLFKQYGPPPPQRLRDK